MAKVVFFAVFLAALVVVSSARDLAEPRFSDEQYCQRELQESSLDACRQVLDRQLAGPAGQLRTGLRTQCCQQLQDVSRECRCAAVRGMVRNFEQSLPVVLPPLDEGFQGPARGQQGKESWGQGGSSKPVPAQKSWGQDSSDDGCLPDGYCPFGYSSSSDWGRNQKQQQGAEGCSQSAEQGQGSYGEDRRCFLSGQAVGRDFGESSSEQPQGYDQYPSSYPIPDRSQGQLQQQPEIIREKLRRARQYAAQLPAMCQVEPQQCEVFSAGQY